MPPSDRLLTNEISNPSPEGMQSIYGMASSVLLRRKKTVALKLSGLFV